MAVDPTQLADYSWADIQKAAKAAMVAAAVGGSSLSINGRSIGRISVADARALYDTATEMLLLESGEAPGGAALVQFRDPV